MNPDLETIWSEFHPRLKRFVLSRISDESAADDILQNVFTKIHSHIDSLKDPANIEGWVFRITRNAIIDHYRTRKIEEALPQNISISEKMPEKIDAKTGYDSIKAIIKTLPHPYAQALLLTEFEGLTQKELSKKLNISVSGAKSRVQRARRMLKAKLAECCNIRYDSHGTIVDYQCSEHFLSWFKKTS